MCSEEQKCVRVFCHGDLFCLLLHVFCDRLPLTVLHIKLLCQLTRTHEIFGCEKLERSQRGFKPAGCIQTWTEYEANLTRCCPVDLHLCNTSQGEKPLPLGLANLPESLADQ